MPGLRLTGRLSAAAAAAVLAIAATSPATPAVEPGGGPATGAATCGDDASLDLVSPAFVYRGEVRGVRAEIRGECVPLGPSPHAEGPARLVGDGVACGLDGNPFVGAYFLQGPRAIVVFDGTCVIDGIEQRGAFFFEGVVSGDGSLTGVLATDGDADVAQAG